MKLSLPTEIVLQLARQEAIAADFVEIVPEQLLTGLLKFAELPTEEPDGVGVDADAHQLLCADVRLLQQMLAARAIDGKRVRRALRAKLGKGSQPHQGQHVSRSSTTRKIFDEAARVAAAEPAKETRPEHLLEALFAAPTPVMVDVIGDAIAMPRPRVATPILDRWGKNLIELAQAGRLPASQSRAAGAVLLQAIADGGRPSIYLVADEEWNARDALHMAALMMMSATSLGLVEQQFQLGTAGLSVRLKERQLIDIRGRNDELPSSNEVATLHKQLWAEASTSPRIVLIDALPHEASEATGDGCLEVMKDLMMRRSVQAIIVMTRQAHAELITTDPAWKRAARTMYVGRPGLIKIPDQL